MMMTRLTKWVVIVLVGAVLLSGLQPDRAAASPGVWQSPIATAVPGPHVEGIEPSSMWIEVGGDLTVLGNNFVDGAAIRLVNWGVLPTTFINDTTLTAKVPASVKVGAYVVQVRNPDGQTSPETPQLRLNSMPEPTAAPPPPGPAPFVRPLLTVASYSTNPGAVTQGKSFILSVAIKNVADDTAFNVVLTIPSGDFVPIGNAGTQTVQKIHIGETIVFNQEMQAKSGIGGGLKPIELKITYNTREGTSYSETPTVSINVTGSSGGGVVKPTVTPVPKQPQLIVSDYRVEPQVLSPGLEFKLFMTVQNVGTGDATRLSVVLGGAATSGSGTGDGGGTGSGTGGGVSGAGGDFAVFGPIGSSNVKFYPSVTMTDALDIEQNLIVNSTAKSGAYTVKVSLVYDDPKGQRRTDDQVITLMVLVPPLIEISYSRDPGSVMAGQMWAVPLQVVNVSRNTTQLGKLEIIAPDGVSVQNGSAFIGQLEAGGQFPLDAQLTPNDAGTLEFTARVNYLDDFNRPQVISQTFSIEVEAQPEQPPIDPSAPNGPIEPVPTEESLGDQLLRLILGLLGLDSARPQPAINGGPLPGEFTVPGGSDMPDGGIQVVPAIPKG